MIAASGASNDAVVVVDRGRVSDDDLLQTIRRDLAAVYTDVLRLPIPDAIAAVLNRLESTFRPAPDFRLK